MTGSESRRITDLGTLKALAHPLRSCLYRSLYTARTATASQLAEQVDEAVSLVSYHLRKLAEYGLIEEAPQQSGDGRERWWRPAQESVSIHDADFRDAPERTAAHLAASRVFLEHRVDLFRRHLDERATWGPEWGEASFDSEFLPRFTPAELAALARELHALVDRHEKAARAAEDGGDTEGRENTAIHLYGFPFRS
ncbi:ArsR/SmtB family transcription factor [Streptomyces sp. NPDC058045]|uniref:ArsR/SmtB family transcription factor n=1 Tax=Streptomyces sp. NPDC058045 TaxID=3346311 RepID=UPI0036EE737D